MSPAARRASRRWDPFVRRDGFAHEVKRERYGGQSDIGGPDPNRSPDMGEKGERRLAVCARIHNASSARRKKDVFVSAKFGIHWLHAGHILAERFLHRGAVVESCVRRRHP